VTETGSSTSTVRSPDDFESRLRGYLFERLEERRAVRVGEKDSSEQTAIVRRYSDLFTTAQHAALRDAEADAAPGGERERVYRLRKTCESGVLVAELAPLQDALANAELAAVVDVRGETMPLRTALARIGTLDSYAEREELGVAALDVAAELNDQRSELAWAGDRLQAELTGMPNPLDRDEEEKGISLRELASVLEEVGNATTAVYEALRTRWLDRLLGVERAAKPWSYHAPYVLRLRPFADVYARDRATDVCLRTLDELGLDLANDPNIRTDLEDRPQKAPRPAVIASDPPTVVHLITRPLGGFQDYQSFLHEAGHALHYAGSDPTLPYAFRMLQRDYALTEIYSYLVQAVTREPAWHGRHFELAPEQALEKAEAVWFLDAFIFRRSLAKLHFELDFWSRFPQDGGTPAGYAEGLTEWTGFVYRADRYLADMDPSFYCADYLRAWIRSAQLRAYLREQVGDEWWCSPETGAYLRTLFREGTRPSNEELAERFGFASLDTGPLVAELNAVRVAA
jgi:hypothetical protein